MRRRNYTYPRQHLVSLVNELPNVGDDACPHFLQFLPPKVGVVNARLVQGFCFLDLCGVGSRGKEEKVTGMGRELPKHSSRAGCG